MRTSWLLVLIILGFTKNTNQSNLTEEDNDDGFDKNGCLPGFGFCSYEKMCIPNRSFCDGKRDCYPDSEDERNCTGATNTLADDKSDKPSECSKNHCEHQCKNTPTGAKCECAKGYRLDSDGFSCRDLDECTLPQRACHHFCENQIGSFRCSCAEGYHLKADGKSCGSENPSNGTILLSSQNEIRERPLEDFSDSNFTSVYQTDDKISAFDYFRRDNKLFMIESDNSGGKLVVKEAGKPIKILRENLNHSYNLAVDWIGGNLFFTELLPIANDKIYGLNRVSVCTMDGKFCRVIIEAKDFSPLPVFAIHPMRGLVFYSDCNDKARIMMANMDGSEKQVLVSTPTMLTGSMAIDYLNNDLYFGDISLDNIQRVNIDTKKTTVIAYRLMDRTDAMTFHNGFLYWTELHDNLRIMEVTRNDSRVHAVMRNQYSTGGPLRMTVNDSLHQLEPSTGNPCSELECPWICVIVPGFTAKCLCPDGYTPSGTTCIPENGNPAKANLTHIGLELMSDYCNSEVGCLNGGSCRKEVSNKIVCDCLEPYDGLYCERRKPILSDKLF